jgi:hypothetical protein
LEDDVQPASAMLARLPADTMATIDRSRRCRIG